MPGKSVRFRPGAAIRDSRHLCPVVFVKASADAVDRHSPGAGKWFDFAGQAVRNGFSGAACQGGESPFNAAHMMDPVGWATKDGNET